MPAGTVRDFAHSFKTLALVSVSGDDPPVATFLSSPWTGARAVTLGERRFAERFAAWAFPLRGGRGFSGATIAIQTRY